MPVVKDWIKNHSGWDKEDIKFILANPDWALGSSITPIYTWHKLTYMPVNVREHLERRREEWIERGKPLYKEKKEAAKKKSKTCNQHTRQNERSGC